MSEGTWFSGPVQDAVLLVNQRNCVFIVYIHGCDYFKLLDDSDKSKVLEDVLDDEKVVDSIRKHAVALRFEKNSENAKFFSQYYPVQTIPALYFIKQGAIKAFGTENITQQEVLDKIKATSAENQSNNSQPSEALRQSAENSTVAEDTGADLAVKKAKMQKRLDDVRRQREEKEKKEAKEREIKRRDEAKIMQEAKQTQADKENQVFMEKLRKEKKEAEEHKRKVREQIARDRAEKLAEKKKEQERQISYVGSGCESRQNHEFSNLNIRLLDGSTIRHQFEASDTLSTVKEWIQESRTDGNSEYKLSAQFPTRLFTESDSYNSLRDLNLCPSATIIMKPIYKSTSSLSGRSGGSMGLFGFARSGFDYIYGMIVVLLNFLAGLLETLFPRNGNHAPALSSEQQPFIRNLRGGHRLGGSSSDAGITTAVADKGQRRHPFANRVNTIHDENSSEDDKEKRPTYNGNSVNHE
ncbi:hypothetical protein BY458DRAFT_561043 [Sporodiniella umbellata]|nr:hypothetical protein BY458DRAFT_561043 [Sporodiniella umbellata]